MIKSTNQLIISQKNIIKNYRLSNSKNSKTITTISEAMLVDLEINRTRYYGGDLEGVSNVGLLHNADKIFKIFSIIINKLVTNEKQKKDV